MLSLSVWQLLGYMAASSLFTLAGLAWLVASLASRYHDTVLGAFSRAIGFIGRTVSFLSAAGAIGLIWLSLEYQ